MMEQGLAVLVGLFYSGAVYLLLSKSLIRMLLGVVLLGNAVNLTIFISGRLTREVPPIIGADELQAAAEVANPLPQALILTAIVIGFALFAFLLVLAYRAYQELGADNTDVMRVAEPEDSPMPNLDY